MFLIILMRTNHYKIKISPQKLETRSKVEKIKKSVCFKLIVIRALYNQSKIYVLLRMP